MAAGYLALLVLYSVTLKHIVILDVLTIAIGFVLRAVAGAFAIDVEISQWLLVCTILLALFIALAKRRHELVLLADGATGHRPILGEYSAYLLDQMISVVTASTLVAYIFYTISPETQREIRDRVARADDSVSDLRDLPVPLSGSPPRRRRQSGRAAADRPPAADVCRVVGAVGGVHHLSVGRGYSLRHNHMADFNIRSDSVNVEQIMEQIRARIRDKRGVDYTEQQIHELAAVKMEKFLDPRGVRSDLLEEFRRMRPPIDPPVRPNYVFDESTLFETHRAPIRWIRRLLLPILKLFFNPNPLIQALHIQSQLNTMHAEAEALQLARGPARDRLTFEVMHNLVLETTRMGIEVKSLKMRVESLASRLEFNERRAPGARKRGRLQAGHRARPADRGVRTSAGPARTRRTDVTNVTNARRRGRPNRARRPSSARVRRRYRKPARLSRRRRPAASRRSDRKVPDSAAAAGAGAAAAAAVLQPR